MRQAGVLEVVAALVLLLSGWVAGTYWERRAERRDPRHAEAIAAKDRRIRHLQKQVAVIVHQRNEVMEALRRERDRRAS